MTSNRRTNHWSYTCIPTSNVTNTSQATPEFCPLINHGARLIRVYLPPILHDAAPSIPHRKPWICGRRIGLELQPPKCHARIAGVTVDELALETTDADVHKTAAIVARGDASDAAAIGRVNGHERGAIADAAVDFAD